MKDIKLSLLADIHGFPTYALSFGQTRYNFCHLEDVCNFIRKVYTVDTDVLLSKQEKKREYTPPLKPIASYGAHDGIKKLILTLCDKPIRANEIAALVLTQHPELNVKTVQNCILPLVATRQLTRLTRGFYQVATP
jgi:hypothetical protein